MCVLCIFTFYKFLSYFSHSPFFSQCKHVHVHTPPHTPTCGSFPPRCLPCLCVCVLLCTLLFQAMTCQFRPHLFLESQSWRSSSIFCGCCVFHAFLPHYDAPPAFRPCPQFVCEVFQTGFTKCQGTKTWVTNLRL